MGIWDRLGSVIKSYLASDDDDRIFRNRGAAAASGDPDVDAAFDELNDFLGGNKAGPREERGGHSASGRAEGSRALPPESLRGDFAELGVPFGSSAGTCKEAYKKLLKIHHPDRHAGHPGNFKKATEKCARINAANDRIEQWRNNA